MPMPILTLVGLIAVFVLVNALFVAAEFALVSAPRASIETRAAKGDRLARRILETLTSPLRQDRYIATSQLAITVTSLGLGMYGEHELAHWVERHLPALGGWRVIAPDVVAAVVAVAALAFFHIVIGEMVPKTLAMLRPELLVRLVYWPMRVSLVVLYPFVRLSSGVARSCLKLLGVTRQENVHEQFHTAEELALIVEESAEGGALRAESGRLLRELFEFGDLTAGQAMTPRVRVNGIPLGATPAEVRDLVTAHGHTRYPVFDGDLDHIVGMLHVKDLLRKIVADQPVAQADLRPIPVVPTTTALDDVLALMQRAHAHMAIVIDEHGGAAGIVSLEDLFDEVVGEIDEGAPAAPLGRQPDGSVRATGTVRVEELGHAFDVDLSHEDVDSVSGLVLARLDRPPVVGDIVEYGRIRLEVTATSGHGVAEVRATLLPEHEEAP